MWRLQKYWVGLVFLAIGALLLANNLELLPVVVADVWHLVWPLFVIVAGGSWLLGQIGGNFGWFPVTLAGMVTAYGVLVLLNELNVTDFRALDVFVRGWPLFILAIGLEMLFGGGSRRGVRVYGPGRWTGPGKRVYVGRLERENGNWNVRWEDVGKKPESAAGGDDGDGAAETGDAAAQSDGDAAVEAEWVDDDTGREAGEKTSESGAAGAQRRGGRTTGFTNQTRVAGEVRIGSRPWDLEPDTVFNLGAGEVDIDLSTARILPGENFLTIRLWAGQVTIYVPPSLPIAVSSSLTAGQITVFGEDHDGLGPAVSYKSDAYEEADRKVNIRIDLMFGQVDIKEAR